MVTHAHRFVHRAASDGLLRTSCRAGLRLYAAVWTAIEEHRRGVATAKVVTGDELGIQDPQCHWYAASDYQLLARVMQKLKPDQDHDVFVDYGSGKGRVVLVAADHPFHRVIGVEFCKELHDVALQNLRVHMPRVRASSVELIHADATQWCLPPDANILFFNNPFHGEVLQKVCENIKESLVAFPRKITLIYVRPDHFFEKQIEWQSWLAQVDEIPRLEGKVTFYENK